MAREVVFQQWCDLCLGRGEREEAVRSARIQVNDTDRVLDLCEEDWGNVVPSLETMITKYGVRPEELTTAPAPRLETIEAGGRALCPICQKPYKNRGSLTTHVRTMHKMTLDTALVQAGQALPTGSRFRTCLIPTSDGQECGFQSASPQGMGAHQSNAHGLTSPRERAEAPIRLL